jgi:PEP-CTERM motif
MKKTRSNLLAVGLCVAGFLTGISSVAQAGTGDVIPNTPAPEPASAGLLLIGLGAAACYRRFNRNKKSD